MTSIDLYDELVKNHDRNLLASQRDSRQSLRDAATDEFEILVKQIRHCLDEVADNNRDILRLKDKLITNAKQDRQTQLCLQIKKTCDANYLLLTEMREKLQTASKIVQNERKQSPNQPETFSKIYRKQHLSQQVDKMLSQSYTVQKLVEKFSIETSLKRIRLVLPDISLQQAEKMAKDRHGLQKATTMKMTGKASLKLKYAHEDILSKAKGIAQLEASVEQNLKLMKEVSLLVHQQGEMIDNILKNVTEAKDYVGKAVIKLEEQKDRHKKTRKKICCIIFIGLIILAIVLTPIIITVVKKNSSPTPTPTPPTPPTPDNSSNTVNSTTVNSSLLIHAILPFQ